MKLLKCLKHFIIVHICITVETQWRKHRLTENGFIRRKNMYSFLYRIIIFISYDRDSVL